MKNLQNGKCQWQAWKRMHWYFLPKRCGWFELAFGMYFKHSSKFKINFCSWLFKPGKYIVSLALSLHLLTFLAWYHYLGSLQDNTISSSMVSSSLEAQYGCISLGTSLMVLVHPCIMVCLNSASLSSS